MTRLPGNSFEKLELAIQASLAAAKAGDIILLSPGGTSLDEFKSFEDRGDFFVKTCMPQ
jgi:UDP-N-acetylmuramoylalanine--D-glutamate ligase